MSCAPRVPSWLWTSGVCRVPDSRVCGIPCTRNSIWFYLFSLSLLDLITWSAKRTTGGKGEFSPFPTDGFSSHDYIMNLGKLSRWAWANQNRTSVLCPQGTKFYHHQALKVDGFPRPPDKNSQVPTPFVLPWAENPGVLRWVSDL